MKMILVMMMAVFAIACEPSVEVIIEEAEITRMEGDFRLYQDDSHNYVSITLYWIDNQVLYYRTISQEEDEFTVYNGYYYIVDMSK